MLDLFRENHDHSTRNTSRYIRTLEQYRLNIEKIKNEYNNGNFIYINNNHLLVQLIKGGDGDITDEMEYLEVASRRAMNYSRRLGINPQAEMDKKKSGIFLDDSINERIMAYSDRYEIQNGDIDNIEPVKLMWHPYATLDMPFLNGNIGEVNKKWDKGYRIASIYINVYSLMWKFFHYKNNCLDNGLPINISEFVSSKIIPYMNERFMDISILNIMYRRKSGSKLDVLRDTHHFFLIEGRLGKVIDKKFIESLMARSFEEYISLIPSLKGETMDSIMLPDLLPISKTLAFHYTAMAVIMEILLIVPPYSLIKQETSYYADFDIMYRRLKKTGYLDSIVEDRLDEIHEIMLDIMR